MGDLAPMKLKRFDGINVVPFIDIMLVLLVIVLTTASFIAKGEIPLELPTASSSVTQHHQTPIAITITKENELFIEHKKINPRDLTTIISSYPLKTHFKIYCDKEAKFDYFISILDTLQGLHYTNLAVVTQK